MYDDNPGELPSDESIRPAVNPKSAPERHGLTLQPGGRSAMAAKAERIGSALGTAHRQLRHGLELVHRPEGREGHGLGQSAQDYPAGQVEEHDLAARMMQAIEEEVAQLRRQAAGRLVALQSPAEARLQRFRGRLCDALSGIKLRARRVVAANPVQTIAAIAGFCLACSAALRLRRSHHC